jgi:hypothetical protein
LQALVFQLGALRTEAGAGDAEPRLVELHLKAALIELDQGLSGGHPITGLHQHAGDTPADFGTDLGGKNRRDRAVDDDRLLDVTAGGHGVGVVDRLGVGGGSRPNHPDDAKH